MNSDARQSWAPSTGNHPGHIRFSGRDLAMRGAVRVPLASQPLGISYDPHSNQVVIAFYFEPKVGLGRLRQDGGDIVMDMQFVQGAEGTTRLFPDFFNGDFNRAQTAFLDPDGNLCVTRNGDRQTFVIAPPAEAGQRWKLLGTMDFPDTAEQGAMIHSLLFKEGRVTTIESDAKCESWSHNFYKPDDSNMLKRVWTHPSPPWRYGIDNDEPSGSFWTVTDFRTGERPGVYRNDEIVVRGLCGNGIAILPSGDALVTQYGSSIEQPGALVFVPAHMLRL